ncbi:helix-turn-helix transcriptional regulator [Streptomyces sp. NPDC051576]|uniref:helix-turn-helix domain-containing protein n=1 Tax=Streptomyces sp. NPDC051576 TaxID=3155803 RepID=UPI0034305903
MTDFDAIDALLADARRQPALPPAEQRRALREALDLSRAQVAQALGVSPSTMAGWEQGRDPGGAVRERYAYFLQSAQDKLRTQTAAPTPTASRTEPAGHTQAQTPAPDHTTGRNPGPHQDQDQDQDPDRLPAPAPCVLCGAPATHHVEGYPQHLNPADCTQPHPPQQPAPQTSAPLTPTTSTTAPGPEQDPPPAPRRPPGTRNRPRNGGSAARTPDLIASAVTAALAEHAGDVDAAAAALVKRAIPDAMALLDTCRIGARYDIVGHPPLPDVLRKKSAHGADGVWEARPHWTRPGTPPGPAEVTALDINGAYLSALKTHLPLGALEYSTGNIHSRRRSGIHLITPPDWDHHTHLPNPLGDRDEPGPVWVTEPTLRLLQRLAGENHGPLCDPPVIHESWTSGSTEQLFEKFRQILRDAREKAITENDEVTLEYVKSMYSKFVSTMGESNFNRALYRPDWMHIIRSQAFVNLWLKAHKAHTAGLTVMRVMGTDELHLAGNWRQVFTEGRGVSQVKIKDVYTPDTGER